MRGEVTCMNSSPRTDPILLFDLSVLFRSVLFVDLGVGMGKGRGMGRKRNPKQKQKQKQKQKTNSGKTLVLAWPGLA